MNMERLWNGSDRGDIHTRRRTTLFAICRAYVVKVMITPKVQQGRLCWYWW